MSYSTQESPLLRYFKWGLSFSLLLHLVLIVVLNRPQVSAPKSFDVSLVFEPEKKTSKQPPQQIVSPPDRMIDPTEPFETNFLSDKNSKVDKQQLHRGDGPQTAPIQTSQPSMQQPASQKAQSQNQSTNSEKASKEKPAPQPEKASPQKNPDFNSLILNDKGLIEKYSKQQTSTDKNGDVSRKQNTRALNQYRAFSRPAGSGAAFIGNSGSNDFLPNLPDGDITLLNAKADQYAVFVRRVATNVFSQIRNAGWEQLSPQEVQSIADFSTVKAVLSPKGELLSVVLDKSCGSQRFDGVLLQAAQHGSRDPNPPAGAAALDGNIHFIFQARSWTEVAANSRTGAPFERRWLMLGTGLE